MGALEETIARIYKLHFHFIKILPRLRRFFEPSQMRNGKRCHSSENVCKLKHARWKFDFHFADTWNAIPKLRKLTPNSTATKLALVWKIPKIRGKYWYTAYPESYVIVSDSVSRLFVCGGWEIEWNRTKSQPEIRTERNASTVWPDSDIQIRQQTFIFKNEIATNLMRSLLRKWSQCTIPEHHYSQYFHQILNHLNNKYLVKIYFCFNFKENIHFISWTYSDAIFADCLIINQLLSIANEFHFKFENFDCNNLSKWILFSAWTFPI